KEEDFYKDDPAPLLRKNFKVAKSLKEARLYIAGLGYYEARLNGEKVGDHWLDPGWTNYGKQILYSTFDVTSQLQSGENVLGVVLGNGFYNPLPLRIFEPLRERLYIGRPCLKAQLRLVYADGSVETIITDQDWKTTQGPILRNNVYLGEWYDARKEIKGWDSTAGDDSQWKSATLLDSAPTGELTAQMQPAIKATKIIKPTQMTETRPGEFIFDMGQNFAGVIRLKVNGPKGTTIKIRYGEDVYSDKSLNVMTTVAGQRKKFWNADWSIPGQPQTCWQEDRYTLKGEGEEVWSPRFTFHGFRYVEITGWPGRPTLDDIEGIRLNADLERSGFFSCSEPMLNKLDTVLDYTFKSNVFSVQSDCPAREKFGYGGDIVGVARTFCWYYDMENFYRKVIRDFANDQRPLGGMTETAPYNGLDVEGLGDGSGPIGWQLAFAFVQKQLYDYYGDKEMIKAYYPAFLKQVQFLVANAKDHMIEKCINDHESLEERIPALFATAHYYHHVKLLVEFAQILGKKEDVNTYSQLAEQIRNAFINRFVNTENGLVGKGTQADQAFALYYNLLPETAKEAVFKGLLKAIEKQDGHIASGIFGVPAILTVLREENRNDVAYDMVTKDTYPGWGHMLKSGATTLWETWKYSDQVYSHNHPMFGSVGEWMFQSLGGINSAAPGFKEILIKPQLADSLNWVNCRYQSIHGDIVSNWKKENGRFTLEVQIPVNTKAIVCIPSSPSSRITENGTPVSALKEIKVLDYKDGYTLLEVGSGTYYFERK
ncbi:MAG: family 78 glycoside hydrolase catalytic domain, partial [Parabacteroides sp.]|nr:family 78 glycoside hydrolase catalytic domain [Parabacteroides sp.]